jgi:hypothetical protein
VTADLPGRSGAVTVAYVHANQVAYSWHHSMIELLGYDMAGAGRVLAGGYVGVRCGADGLVQARNKAVREFLDDRNADWLLWIDTDMGFGADTAERLLEAADPVERPIVGGLCFVQNEERPDGIGGWRCGAGPTVYDWTRTDDGEFGWRVRWDYPHNTLVQCAGTGAACVLVHRSVFTRLEERYGRVWYDRVPNTSTGQLIGEDLSFCLRAGAMGIPIYVHTGVRTSHLKAVWLAEEDYARQRPIAPATEETAVIVPVLNRPGNAEPFMATLRASTGLATVYAIADADDRDTANAWKEAGAIVLGITAGGDDPGTFAQKVNIGYRESQASWLFLTGDDVRFHPGWLDHAQAAAADGRYHVIGTNDLANPRVLAGEHATHLLVRRSYVDERGASWDGPGVVAHEGYRHWWVDDEVVTVAKQRKVWTMALGSRVEHLHPAFGKGQMDATYELGAKHVAADKKLFEERMAAHA